MENKHLTERERINALVFRLGISIRQLAKIVDMNAWTGHKNYEAMLPYIAIAGDTSVQQMSKFNLL